MILGKKPLSMSESQEYIDKETPEIKGFIKKFVKLDHKKAKVIREKIDHKTESERLMKVWGLNLPK